MQEANSSLLSTVLVGNKIDLETRQVSTKEGESFARKLNNVGFLEVSVYDNVNLNEIFLQLLQEILNVNFLFQSKEIEENPESLITISLITNSLMSNQDNKIVITNENFRKLSSQKTFRKNTRELSSFVLWPIQEVNSESNSFATQQKDGNKKCSC